MEVSVEDYLINKGYPVSSKGGLYFSSLLEEVVYSLENNETTDEIKKELPYLAHEYRTGFFQVDRSSYYSEMKKFCFSGDVVRKVPRKNTIQKELLRMGKDIARVNGIISDKPKVIKKCK